MIWTLLSMLLQLGMLAVSVAVMVAMAVLSLVFRLTVALVKAGYRHWQASRQSSTASSQSAAMPQSTSPAPPATPRRKAYQPFRY